MRVLHRLGAICLTLLVFVDAAAAQEYRNELVEEEVDAITEEETNEINALNPSDPVILFNDTDQDSSIVDSPPTDNAVMGRVNNTDQVSVTPPPPPQTDPPTAAQNPPRPANPERPANSESPTSPQTASPTVPFGEDGPANEPREEGENVWIDSRETADNGEENGEVNEDESEQNQPNDNEPNNDESDPNDQDGEELDGVNGDEENEQDDDWPTTGVEPEGSDASPPAPSAHPTKPAPITKPPVLMPSANVDPPTVSPSEEASDEATEEEEAYEETPAEEVEESWTLSSDEITEEPTTAAPTTATPTLRPTSRPTRTTLPPTDPVDTSVEVEGEVAIRLQGISTAIPPTAQLTFQQAAHTFLEVNLAQLMQPFTVEEVSVVSHIIIEPSPDTRTNRNGGRRSLRNLATISDNNFDQHEVNLDHARQMQEQDLALHEVQVHLLVSGSFQAVRGQAEDEEEFGLNRIMARLFTIKGEAFMEDLKMAGSVTTQEYFEPLESVRGVYVDPDGTLPPTPTERPEPSGDQSFTTTILPLGALIGIVVGGIVAIILLAAIGRMWIVKKKDRKNLQSVNSIPSNDTTPIGSSNNGVSSSAAGVSGPKYQQYKDKTEPQEQLPQSHPPTTVVSNGTRFNKRQGSAGTSGSFNNHRTEYDSDADTQVYNASVMHGVDSGSHAGTGGDSISYAYSLEPGIDPSVAYEPSVVSAGGASGSASAISSVPTEIPHIVPNTNSRDDTIGVATYPGNSTSSTVTTGTHSWLKPKEQDDNLITREVFAPPGKLGIVIDTTLDGPVVHKVNAGSPLEGRIWPGDIIIGIDSTDTRAMSAQAITALMVKTANVSRKLTIVSDTSK